MNQATELASDLLAYIDNSPSPWHAVSSTVEILTHAGFESLSETDCWDDLSNGKYFVVRDQSSIVAFILGKQQPDKSGFNIIGAHSDSPGLRIKPNPLIKTNEWLRLGVEVYGGPILATFSDRDLSLAGRVSIELDTEAKKIENRLVKFDKPIIRIPNLPIHLNRDVNKEGLKFQPQLELPPLVALANSTQSDDQQFLHQLIAKALEVSEDKILGWELAVYDTQQGQLWGTASEFLTNSQLDNLASCHAALSALLENNDKEIESTQVIAFFDHEEIGSNSQKGADGCFLGDILKRISLSQKLDEQQHFQALAKSTLLSADMSHAWHPAFPQKFDQNHRPIVNAGPVLKINNNQRYTTQAPTEGLFVKLCKENQIPFQKFVNRSDLSCGSTIGPLTASQLGISSFDVGAPMFAMHSIRESAGVKDHYYMMELMAAFLRF